MLSDAKHGKAKPKNRPTKAKTNLSWGDKQKLEALHSYLALGNLALVSRVLGIPEVTLRVWKSTEWWKTAVEEVKLQEKIELSNKMKKIVEAAHTIVGQRLEQGDPYINPKTGTIEYKPVALKDAHKVAVDTLNAKIVVDKTTVDAAPVEEAQSNKLEELANKFAEMAMKSIEKKQNKERTVDAEIVEIK